MYNVYQSLKASHSPPAKVQVGEEVDDVGAKHRENTAAHPRVATPFSESVKYTDYSEYIRVEVVHVFKKLFYQE